MDLCCLFQGMHDNVSVLILSLRSIWTADAGLGSAWGWLSHLLIGQYPQCSPLIGQYSSCPLSPVSPVAGPLVTVTPSPGEPGVTTTQSTGTHSEPSPASSPCGPAQTRSTPCCTGRIPGTPASCAARSWCVSWPWDTSPSSGGSWHQGWIFCDKPVFKQMLA